MYVCMYTSQLKCKEVGLYTDNHMDTVPIHQTNMYILSLLSIDDLNYTNKF
jgi:hypothetical protein